MRRRRLSQWPAHLFLHCLLLISLSKLTNGEDTPPGPVIQPASHVDNLSNAVSGAFSSLHLSLNKTSTENSSNAEEDKKTTETTQNSDQNNTGLSASNTTEHSPGRAALEAARNATISNDNSQPLPHTLVKCGEGACEELSNALLETIEGDSCRSIFFTGKCPNLCATAIGAITNNNTWPECATACAGDVVTGAAERWVELCEARKETLIEQGKEAVKSIHQGITKSLHARVLIQVLVGSLILVLGVFYGYRRGSISAITAYRLQKRRLIGRKNSDNRLPI